jgi:head-tail adaptor
MNYSPGQLDERITLTLSPTQAKHAVTNEIITTPGTSQEIWAKREEAVSSNVDEGEIDMAMVSKKYVYFIIRYRQNIGPLCSLADRFSNDYNIEAVEPIGRRKFLKLRAELITHTN